MNVIDNYLQTIDPRQKAMLEHVRSIIKQKIPDGEDTIGYGMPVIRYNNKYLIGFCAFKNHMSIFPGASPTEQMKDKLSGHKLSKGTIQFTIDNPLPDELLNEIIDLCMKRNSTV